MEVEKSSINILTWILIAVIIYMIWAYYHCSSIEKKKSCSPFVGLDPLKKLLKGHHKHTTSVVINTNTSTDTSTTTSSSTDTNTSTGTSTSTGTNTSSNTSVVNVTNSNGAVFYVIKNGVAYPTNYKVKLGDQVPYISSTVIGSFTFYQTPTQYGWLISSDVTPE